MADKPTAKDYEKLGREIWSVYETGYVNRPRMLWNTFIRGVVYGFGIFLGGTIVVSLVLWGLTLFKQVPVLTPLVDKIEHGLRQ